jgi:hypothetical protein
VSWLAVGLTFSLVFFPPESRAAFLSSEVYSLEQDGSLMEREQALGKIQRHLEFKVVHQRLADLGLTQVEIMDRLGQMTDEQIHQLATHLDALIPGGDALGTVAVVLVILILLVVLLQITGHKVIITK